MAGNGWISLHRKITENWVWKTHKPFDKRAAWIDILLMVNHKKDRIPLGNKLIEVGVGERITSERKLAERWGWSRTKVRNFLELLKNDDMIEVQKPNQKRTTIKVLNYSKYQQTENHRKTIEKPEKNQSSTIEKPEKNINNNDNNDNNVNNDNKNNNYTPTKNEDKIPYKEIINYLNQKTGSKYRSSTQKTRTLIHARWEEKFRLDDFKTVIDKKCAEWLNDKKMKKYLRPVTLFGPKFESYLNQLSVKSQDKNEQLRELCQEALEEDKENE